mmetsp:Transcript_30301/g.57117  ORF Transcript_30301/g.57117 Transcript_30301/m.57117 type:complete len:477 (-) Transcript_30301:1020-2450(-)
MAHVSCFQVLPWKPWLSCRRKLGSAAPLPVLKHPSAPFRFAPKLPGHGVRTYARHRFATVASQLPEDLNDVSQAFTPMEKYYSQEGIPASLLAGKRKSKSALQKSQTRFVEFFRRASPYVESHRGGIFVIIIPGDVLDNDIRLTSILKDIALIHQLGVHLVLVIGSTHQIDIRLQEQGLQSKFMGEYRVTDPLAMQIAMESAGKNTVNVQAQLSKAPPVVQLRRQGMPERLHQNVSVRTTFGNFVAAKRRGVVDGIDFGETGEVRYVDAQAIQDQLNLNNVVVLSNLGYSAAGEVLNCHTFEVATMAAIQLKADKVVCMMGEESTRNVTLMAGGQQALSLISAERLVEGIIQDYQLLKEQQGDLSSQSLPRSYSPTSSDSSKATWYIDGCPVELCAAIAACRGGVKRVHLVDSTVEGVLLLELYTRDGIGMMVFSDDYEVSRPACLADLDSLARLLAPLEVFCSFTIETEYVDVGN